MVKRQDQGNAGRCKNQGENGCQQEASKIGPSTAYNYCREGLSPFMQSNGLCGALEEPGKYSS